MSDVTTRGGPTHWATTARQLLTELKPRRTEQAVTTTDPMPVFTIKAKDRLALATVEAYRAICENAGLTEQASEVAKAWLEIRDWQRRNPERMQFPDHRHVPVSAT